MLNHCGPRRLCYLFSQYIIHLSTVLNQILRAKDRDTWDIWLRSFRKPALTLLLTVMLSHVALS